MTTNIVMLILLACQAPTMKKKMECVGALRKCWNTTNGKKPPVNDHKVLYCARQYVKKGRSK